VVLNVTVTDTTSSSVLTAYPSATPRPMASNLNWISGQTVPNRVVVPVGANGAVSLFNLLGITDVIVDVGGWFTDGSVSTATGGTFNPLTPSRICDTRPAGPDFPSNQCSGSTISQGGTLSVAAAGAGGIPTMTATAPPTAVILNVTVTRPTRPGYLTVYPSDGVQPLASDLNWAADETAPNLVVVKLGSDGKIKLFNNAGSVDVIVDVAGWLS
jgi:hypothetical protein